MSEELIYRYVKVVYDADSPFEYSYRDDGRAAKPNDFVWVPVGKLNEKKIARVVSVGDYSKECVPFPLEKTKSILRVATDDEVAQIEANW